VVGAEDEGLKPRWLKNATQQVAIPMHGKNDSLNVATAAAILLYEALRQRSQTRRELKYKTH
jgi:TrmH family RNA methyltransferase